MDRINQIRQIKNINCLKNSSEATAKNSASDRQKCSGLFGSIITLVLIIILGGSFCYYLNSKHQEIVNETSALHNIKLINYYVNKN